MVKKADVPRHIITCAFALAATQGWRDTSLGDIADAAKLPLGELLQVFPSKTAMLVHYTRMIDADVLKGDEPELAAQPPRDRLFDVMMRRFDALATDREALRAIIRASLCDPLAALCGALALRRSMATMLEAARISSSGLAGIIRVKGLAAIYLSVFRVWLNDDSEDMAKTMAALDRDLRRAEYLFGLCRLARRRRDETAAEPA